jgi:hypothetical protein
MRIAHARVQQGDRAVGRDLGVHQPPQRVRSNERLVAVVHQDSLGAEAPQAFGGNLHGVPGAELRLLHDRVDRFG